MDVLTILSDAWQWLFDTGQYLLPFAANLFVFGIGLLVAAAIILWMCDVFLPTDSAIRKNYPLFGRFRFLMIYLGEFLRNYLFYGDREEKPFNRAEMHWINLASDDTGTMVAFGSTKDTSVPGTRIFANTIFPVLEEEAEKPQCPPIGVGYCVAPYQPKRFFNCSGMSFGALGGPAVRALSGGSKIAGYWLNTGEGGLSPHHIAGGGDIVFQIGTAKFGVCDKEGNLCLDRLKAVADNPQVKMFEIKLSQGAKPGKGGILPAAKVSREIAETRGITEGVAAISPNRHKDISNNEELLDFIVLVRALTSKPVGIKMAIGNAHEVEALCEAIKTRGLGSAPDFITVDSGDGGTGAAPISLMDNTAMLLKESLPLVIDMLNCYGLRERIKVIASGKQILPVDVAWCLCMGADYICSARGFMFSLGCIQAKKCHMNTCPAGITTHNPRLQKGLNPKSKAVKAANYCLNMEKEVEIIAHTCGKIHPHDLCRDDVRIVQANGETKSLSEIHPDIPALVSAADTQKST